MRDPKKTTDRFIRLRTNHSRLLKSGRRNALAATLLLVSSPVMADQPGKSEAISLPPLPVQQVANNEVYGNPFCEPELRPIRYESVQQTSTEMRSAIRLKAAGAVIGLQPIGGKPISVRPSGLKIESPSVAGIQENPLMQSEHHSNPDLVDVSLPIVGQDANESAVPMTSPILSAGQSAELAELPPQGVIERVAMPVVPPEPVVVAAPVQQSIMVNPAAQASQARLVPARPMQAAPQAQTATLTNSAPQETTVERAVVSSLIPATVAPNTVESAPSGGEPAMAIPIASAPPVEARVQQNPVYFSMSDSSTPTSVGESAKSTDTIIEQSIQSPSDVAANDAAIKMVEPVVIPMPDAAEPDGVVALAQPLEAALADAPLPPLPMRQKLEMDSQAKAIPKPVVARPVSSTSRDGKAMLSTHKRYRAPVAVDAPPVAIAKPYPDSMAGSAAYSRNSVTVAEPVNVSNQNTPTKTVELTKLYLSKAQVRSLTIGGMVRRVNVVNKNVCQAIATGPNQLKLIGTGNGVTRLVVWADTSGNSHTRARTFEIHVQDAVETTGGSVGDKTHTLNRSIYDAFPAANVSVQEFRDRLIVSGECESEDDAKKIIRMVRKTCLIPVRDEIKVR